MSPTCNCCGQEVPGENNKMVLKAHLKAEHDCVNCRSRGEHCPYNEIALQIVKEARF